MAPVLGPGCFGRRCGRQGLLEVYIGRTGLVCGSLEIVWGCYRFLWITRGSLQTVRGCSVDVIDCFELASSLRSLAQEWKLLGILGRHEFYSCILGLQVRGCVLSSCPLYFFLKDYLRLLYKYFFIVEYCFVLLSSVACENQSKVFN